MKLKVEFEVKDYIRNWSDQDIIFEYKQVDAVLHIIDTASIPNVLLPLL